MKALGLAGGETLTAQKLSEDEQIPQAPLIGSDGELTPAARRIFSEWYDRFCDANGDFTKEGAARFIQACCGDLPAVNDNRITGLFQAYDADGDGKMQKEEFLVFYTTCSRGEKATTVRENLRAFNVRPDLKKLSEVEDEATAVVEELPRYFIPRHQDHFDQLMSLLDGKDKELAEQAWELIQMLATNLQLYRQVLQLEIAKEAGSESVDWTKFFDKSSSYRLLYSLQIVQAVLEDGEAETERVILLNADAFPAKRVAIQARKARESSIKDSTPVIDEASEPAAAALAMKKRGSQVVASAAEDAQLRAQWAEEFARHGGFQHILSDFMACTLPSSDDASGGELKESLDLKYVAFMLRLLRTFIMAAFSTSDADTYKVATLARRSSSTKDGEQGETDGEAVVQEGSSFKQLQNLLAGPTGLEIVELVDYSALQRQVLRLTSQVLQK